MKPEHNKIAIIIIFAIFAVLALVLGLVLGLKKFTKDKTTKNNREIVNSYSNTAELIQKYPVINSTTVLPGLEEKIQNRLLTGFENWNRGFDAWKAWGNILYTNESIYNVHGARLSLAQYQTAMDISLQQQIILMGDFHNMLIIDNFAAIHYDFKSGKDINNLNKSRVMEFVQFKDYGEKLGTRVVEGWGSTKDVTYNGLTYFQGEEEKTEQEYQNILTLNYNIPKTNNLTEKYYIKYKTNYNDSNANDILKIILEGFDSWNTNITEYENWVNKAYDVNAISSSLDERERNMTQYINEIRELFKKEKITKLYFDNVLIRENWTALHYRFRRENITSHEKDVADRMEFLKFEEKEGQLKIVASWIQ